MKLIPHTFPIPFLEIQNFYNTEELLLVWDELEYLKQAIDNGHISDYGNYTK